MKCPMCKSEMEKGLMGAGFVWVSGNRPKSMGTWLGVYFMGRQKTFVTAYKCPKCGKVELTTEVK